LAQLLLGYRLSSVKAQLRSQLSGKAPQMSHIRDTILRLTDANVTGDLIRL
jgi:hypothetical protein